jgi:hypothetical protein
MQHLTLETVTFALVVVLYFIGAVVFFLRKIAPLTATDLDDRAVATWDAWRSWVFRMCPHFWNIVEELYLAGLLQKGGKLDDYRTRLGLAFSAAFGSEMPESLLKDAEALAAGLSAKDRIERKLREQMFGVPVPETPVGGAA